VKLRFIAFFFCFIELCALSIALEQRAHAYVDPGSGLLIFQVAGSMLTGACFVLRKKLRSLLHLGPSIKDTEQNQAREGEAQDSGADVPR
jgi:hypothetical protein